MIIGSSNIVPTGTLATTSGGTINNVVSNLAGSVWNPDGNNPSFTWSGTAVGIQYIAGVGVGFTSVIVRITGGPTNQVTLSLNGCFFIALETSQDFTMVELEFFGEGVLVNFAMGTSFNVPLGGEQAGYQRIPLQDNRVFSSSVDRAAIPVAQSVVREPRSATLTISNMLTTFARTVWYNFSQYALDTGFFYILEDDTEATHSYMCYEPRFTGPVAHASTRSLVRAGVGFRTYFGG